MKRYILLIAVAMIFPVVVFGEEGTTVKTFTTNIPFLDGELTTQGFVDAMYKLAIALASIIVVIRLMMAGAKYMLSDVVSSKSKAREDIKNALFGLLIILGAVLLLGTINPKLVGLGFLNNAAKVTLDTPKNGVVDDIVFKPGEHKTKYELMRLCTKSSYSSSVDQDCMRKNEDGLKKSCLHNNGVYEAKWNRYNCNSK